MTGIKPTKVKIVMELLEEQLLRNRQLCGKTDGPMQPVEPEQYTAPDCELTTPPVDDNVAATEADDDNSPITEDKVEATGPEEAVTAPEEAATIPDEKQCCCNTSTCHSRHNNHTVPSCWSSWIARLHPQLSLRLMMSCRTEAAAIPAPEAGRMESDAPEVGAIKIPKPTRLMQELKRLESPLLNQMSQMESVTVIDNTVNTDNTETTNQQKGQEQVDNIC
jgi:hypothetical protein